MLPKEGYDIVISGVGGKFPGTNNIDELREKLFAKEDLVTEASRWPPGKLCSFAISVCYFVLSTSKLITKMLPETGTYFPTCISWS